MIELSAATVDTINQLCKRGVAFALYRLPHSSIDQFCMQHDGGYAQHERITQLHDAPSFVMSPFDSTTGAILQIRSERDTLPRAEEISSFLPYEAPAPAPNSAAEDYEKRFQQYHARVDSCYSVEKLVLARTKRIDFEPQSAFSPALAYQHTCAGTDRAFHVLAHSPLTGTWLSSTPELLLGGEAENNTWQTQALAGTQKKGGNWSQKNIAEHACVVRHLREVLRHAGIDYRESSSETLSSGEIEHLCARFDMQMEQTKLLPLLEKLAPTPAVAGYPMEDALAFMRANPDIDRQYYTGYLGPYDTKAVTAFYVCLRCMQIYRDSCVLYAGGGIMPESQLREEWEETEQKMAVMQALIARSLEK